MKKLLACVAVSALIGAAAGDADKTPRIDGTWVVTNKNIEGKKLPKEFLDKSPLVFTFKDGKFTVGSTKGNQTDDGTYKLEAKGKAVNLDLTFTEGEVVVGLVKLEDDVMTFAFVRRVKKNEEKVRPRNFDGGNSITVYTLERGK